MDMHSPKEDPQRWVQDHPEPGKEFDREVGINVSAAFGIGLVVVSVLTFIGMWYLLQQFIGQDEDRRVAAVPSRVEQPPPPEPRLQIHPELELQEFLAEQDLRLHSWGWVDQAQDRGHIAIEDAMRLVAERGLPVRHQPRAWEDPLVWRDPSLQHLKTGAMH
jgi:hypothetical protein